MNMHKVILNLIFPAACKQCGGSVSSDAPTACFCKRCWDAIRWFDGPCCLRCGIPYPSIKKGTDLFSLSIEKINLSPFFAPDHLCGTCRSNPPSFEKAISAGPYEGALAEAIKLFKYKKKIHVGRALTDFSPFSKGGVRRITGKEGAQSCSLVPVPLHPDRLREREFNQSAIIASELGKRFEVPVLLDVLIRSRHTRPQVELDMKERGKNVIGAFTVQNEDLIIDKDVILVDDVYTTGSTVNECAQALKKSGAKKVSVVTIARMVG